MQFDEKGRLLSFSDDEQIVHVLSYDERRGIQVVVATSDDLASDAERQTISRNYEYRCLATVLLFAGIYLQKGEAILLVREFHNSKDYIEF